MARGMNHVYLVGALARDPELRYTPQGTPVCDLTVAGEDVVVGGDDQTRNLPWYHRVSLIGKPAENAAEQFKRGSAVMVEGSLEQRSWEDPQTGQKRSLTSIKGLRLEGVQREGEERIQDAGGGLRLAGGMNHAVLVGNLGRDPELRYTASGDAVAGVSIAVSESWKGKDGNWQEKIHWIDLTLWRELAEKISGLHKGDAVMVTGRVKHESWTDHDGTKRHATKLEVSTLEALVRQPRTDQDAPQTPVASAKSGSKSSAKGARGRASAVLERPRTSTLDIDEGLHNLPPDEDLPF